jgi:hypothetical protein
MIFTKEFLRELQQKLRVSDLYPRTKYTVNLLVNKQLQDSDKYAIFDAIHNDILRQNKEQSDPLSLCAWWNEKKLIPKLEF